MSATGEAQAGFTLLEMLTVLALTALISAIVFPSLDKVLTTVTLAQSKAAVLSDLQVARAQSVRSGAAVGVTPAGDGTGYAWTGGSARRLAPGARLTTPGGAAIQFFPDGSASPQTATLSVANRQVELTVDATGAMSATPTPIRDRSGS